MDNICFKLIGIFFSIFLWLSSLSYAQGSSEVSQTLTASQNHLMTPDEQKILQRARKRAYPGGRDEESLKVQAQLSAATRKMAPATEVPADSIAPSTSED